MQHFQGIWGLPGEGLRIWESGSVVQTRWFWGPGGRLQRGVLSLRTSEFWIPDLGDLKAMDLDTLEDNSLVATNPAPQQPGGPEGAGG